MPENVPSKEGYTFSGWSEIPAIMPAYDITVTGSFSVNTYTLTYYCEGEVLATDEIEFGSYIQPIDAPDKEGHTFQYWDGLPANMPAYDVQVYAVYAINSYLITYLIDGDVFYEQTLYFGSTVFAPDAPSKEGHSFNGWENLPETMPAHDVTTNGIYEANIYKVTYIVDGEVIAVAEVEYGATIIPPVSQKDGYDIVWGFHPTTMPAYDITIYGNYTTDIQSVMTDGNNVKRYTIDGKVARRQQRGINILRMPNGSAKKIVIKH